MLINRMATTVDVRFQDVYCAGYLRPGHLVRRVFAVRGCGPASTWLCSECWDNCNREQRRVHYDRRPRGGF